MSDVSILISEPDSTFTIQRVNGTLEPMQKLVGGMLEAVTLDEFHIYLNEEGKMMGLKPNDQSTMVLDSYLPGFSRRDILVGPVLWMGFNDDGNEADTPEHVISNFVAYTVTTAITVIRVGNDIWVYDDAVKARIKILDLLAAARNAAEHGTIEVVPGVRPQRWVESRVELMDHPEITLHDERSDRTFG